ncbi:lon protease homolog, mitochondrial-like [Podarcis raffonei]|uniref:lon protease homolog, mitochondrial-like n=1 Tax=Podarcis raffonei TaxID=65483 RepID=UPI00232998CE|nr:lon protease homolog, mitochondrial-like [Podarcis raffonei]
MAASMSAASPLRLLLWRCRGRLYPRRAPAAARPWAAAAAGSGRAWLPPPAAPRPPPQRLLSFLRGPSDGGLEDGEGGEAGEGGGGGGGGGLPGDGGGGGAESGGGPGTALAPLLVPERVPHVPLIAVARNPVFPRFIKIIEVGPPPQEGAASFSVLFFYF